MVGWKRLRWVLVAGMGIGVLYLIDAGIGRIPDGWRQTLVWGIAGMILVLLAHTVVEEIRAPSPDEIAAMRIDRFLADAGRVTDPEPKEPDAP